MTKTSNLTLLPAMTDRDYLLGACRKFRSFIAHSGLGKDSDQPGQMPSLI